MKSSERRYAMLLRNITSVLMVFAVTSALNTYFLLEISPLFLCVAAVAADILFLFFDRFKKKKALWIALAVVIAAAALIMELAGESARVLLREAGAWIRGAADWFILHCAGDEEALFQPAFALFFACLGTLGCTALCYPLTFHLYSRLALSALALAAVIVLPVMDIPLGKLPLACVGICLVSSVIELVNLQFDRHRVESKRSAGLFLYPVSVLLIVIAVLLPARETPIRWQAVRNLLNEVSVNMETVETTLKIWFGAIPEKFSVTFNGMSFTDEDGSVNANDYAVFLRVSTNSKTRSPIYLRGSISSTYTGTGWEDESESVFTEREPEIEFYETLYSMLRSGLMPERGEDIYKRTMLTIEFDDIITKSVLYSAPLSQVDTDKKVEYSIYGPNLRFQRMQKIGLEYTMSYFETNWGSPTLTEYLRSLTGFRYVDDDTDFDSLHAINGSAVRPMILALNEPDPDYFNSGLTDRLAERARTIREVYTQLPDELPERVYDLAREITKDCETTYDKILAIEDYFQEGYTYSLTPPAFPEDRDFTDWFLFDADEGYCTYYATAAAVLARCVGLPARYVEGVSLTDTLNSREVAELTNQNVHAWVEVYLEGYGWILIEPTPGSGAGRNQEWERRLPVTGDASSSMPEMPPEEPPAEITPPPETDGPSAAELAALAALRRAQMKRFWMFMTLAAVGLILVLAVTALLLSRRAKTKRYNRAPDNEKIRILMREILRCVAITGIHRREDETLIEYVQRAGLGFDYSDMKLADAAMLFMKVRYAGKDATRMEVLAMYRYARELRRETLRQQNVLKRMVFTVQQYVL